MKNMINIMIVDDMPTFREYLESCIDWLSYGFEICCQAKDGREALEMFEKYNPDIVLTDITMPYLDGLKLSERLLEINQDVAVVFITGNSEFEYARRAIKMGAYDYIVKPFEKEELIFSLLKLKDNINKTIEMQLQKDEFIYKDKEEMLRKFIYKQTTAITEKEKQKLLLNNIHFAAEYFLVYTVNTATYENSTNSENIIKWENVIINMLNGMIQIDGTFEVFHDFEGNIVTILNFNSQMEQEQYKGYEFDDLAEMVKQRLGFNIMIGASEYCYGLHNIKEAYYQTLRKINSNHQESNSFLFEYNQNESQEWGNFYSWDVIDQINKNLESLNYDELCNVLNQEFDSMQGVNEKMENVIFISLLSLLLSFLVKKGRNIVDVFGPSFKPYEMLINTLGYTDKREFVLECYHKVISYKKVNKDEKAYLVAQKSIDYIREHYSDSELSIDDISRYLLMNQTYLRKMFKSEANMTLSEYITKCRMEKAKELIQNNEYKISCISTMVGYNDVGYFSKCFKKYYGVSPMAVIMNK